VDIDGWLKGDAEPEQGLPTQGLEAKHGTTTRFLISNLKDMGWITMRSNEVVDQMAIGVGLSLPPALAMAKALKLIGQSESNSHQGCMDWRPAAARIVEIASTKGEWEKESNALHKAGETWGYLEEGEVLDCAERCTLVVLLGGATESEIAGIRAMSTEDHTYLFYF